MVQIQIDLPKELSKKIAIERIKQEKNNKEDTIIGILEEWAKED